VFLFDLTTNLYLICYLWASKCDLEGESGRMEDYVCTHTILASSDPYLFEYNQPGPDLTAAIETFTIDFKRVE